MGKGTKVRGEIWGAPSCPSGKQDGEEETCCCKNGEGGGFVGVVERPRSGKRKSERKRRRRERRKRAHSFCHGAEGGREEEEGGRAFSRTHPFRPPSPSATSFCSYSHSSPRRGEKRGRERKKSRRRPPRGRSNTFTSRRSARADGRKEGSISLKTRRFLLGEKQSSVGIIPHLHLCVFLYSRRGGKWSHSPSPSLPVRANTLPPLLIHPPAPLFPSSPCLEAPPTLPVDPLPDSFPLHRRMAPQSPHKRR